MSADGPLDELLEVIQNLSSNDVSVVIKALNALLMKTSDNVQDNLQIETCPNLLVALADLLDIINPVGCLLFTGKLYDSIESFVSSTDFMESKLLSRGNLKFQVSIEFYVILYITAFIYLKYLHIKCIFF